jgi:hypothetical protein
LSKMQENTLYLVVCLNFSIELIGFFKVLFVLHE